DGEDPADTGFAVAAVDGRAERADLLTRPGGARQQREGGGRRAGGPILGMDGVAPADVAPVLAEQRARGGIEHPDVVIVPLDRDRAPEPAGRGRIVGARHFDTAVEMDGARAVVVVAKRFDRERLQSRLLLSEHGGDLALGGAVDASVGPARLPAIEIGLRFLQTLEAQALERRALGVADGRFDLALA